MPSVDVSDVLFDPDLADIFDVVRQTEVVNDQGRSVVQSTRMCNIVGVITATAPADLQRRDDGQMMPQKISVVTVFRLRGPAPGFQPDQIVYGGTTFTVTEILPFSRFGKGFVEALATSMNAINLPTP